MSTLEKVKKEKSTGALTVPPPPASIATMAQLWEAAVYYQTQGNSDVSAMQLIWPALVPSIGYQQLANVISGVYANTYWVSTAMSSTILANNLVSALGVSPSQASIYATNALMNWEGAFCRANLGDSGIIPKQGTLTASCDIVVNATNPLTTNFLITNWNNAFLNAPIVGKNYIYLRAQNLGFNYDLTLGGTNDLTVNMFYTTAGFNQPPTSWVQLFTVGSTSANGAVYSISNESFPIPLGTKLASEAFMFNPTSTDHVCLIGVVNSSFFTSNPLTAGSGNWNSATWLASNGAAAWQNVNPAAGTQSSLVFYNQDGTSEHFAFKATCNHFPVGSKLKLSCSDESISFDSGLVTIHHPSQSIEVDFKLPAHYKGKLIVVMEDAKGNPLPSSAVLHLQMAWLVKPGHRQYKQALHHFGNSLAATEGDALDINLGEYTLISSGKK